MEQQQRSGLSVARFCEKHGVATSTLFAWKRRLRQGAGAAAPWPFVRVRAVSHPAGMGPAALTPPGAGGAIELRLGSRRRLVLRPGFDAPTLAAALAVLESRSGMPAAGEESSCSFPR